MKNTGNKTIPIIVLLLANALIWGTVWGLSNTRNTGFPVTPIVPISTPTPQATARPTQTAAPSAARTTTPYVGMYVSSIPSKWEWQGTDNTTVRDASGNNIRTVKYRYDAPPKIYVIWVNESDKVVKVSITDPTAPAKKKNTSSKGSASSLDTSEFVHPEDFYDWNRDDFYDYEDAEDYYYSHGGK